jgi:hypothetical protein
VGKDRELDFFSRLLPKTLADLQQIHLNNAGLIVYILTMTALTIITTTTYYNYYTSRCGRGSEHERPYSGNQGY